MRLLAACPTCSRQYDVSGHSPGTQFHCSCGTVVTIGEPKMHAAAVVRCSSCGGPQQEGALTCQFCGSELSLHDRDLNTMCPSCLARISDKARYCHSCGTLIDPSPVEKEETDLPCPACGDDRRLSSRRIGKSALSVLECERCAGLWVGVETLRQLEKTARTEAFELDENGPGPAPVAAPETQTGGSLYRRCPICGKFMNRQNYGRRSGVIVDRCRDDGVWFDNRELSRILEWIREGGQDETQKLVDKSREEMERLRRRSLEEARTNPRKVEKAPFEREITGEDLLVDLGKALVRSLFG